MEKKHTVNCEELKMTGRCSDGLKVFNVGRWYSMSDNNARSEGRRRWEIVVWYVLSNRLIRMFESQQKGVNESRLKGRDAGLT